MDPQTLLISVLLCLLPVSELRGGIPFALSRGVDPLTAFLVCVPANLLVGPLVYLFLASVHRLLERWALYRRLFERIVARSREKVRGKIERYGYIGLAVFVGIPFPLTGAYSGALGAWVLGMEMKKSFLAISAGVLMAGLIVSLVAGLGIRALYFFLK